MCIPYAITVYGIYEYLAHNLKSYKSYISGSSFTVDGSEIYIYKSNL